MTVDVSVILFQLLAGFLPIILFFRNFTTHYFEVLILLLSSFISTCIGLYAFLFVINNQAIFNYYLIIEVTCLSIFFYRFTKTKYAFIFLIIYLIFFSIWLNEYLYNDVLFFCAKFSSVIYIFYCIFYFVQSLKTNEVDHNSSFKQSFCAAILFYNCSAFFLIYYLMESTKLNLWYVHNFIEGSSKLLIAYALWKLPKTAHS